MSACLLDTFHMNIEEKHPPAAIRATGDRLVHFHVSDNDRGVPGRAHYDFARRRRARSRDIGYKGWIMAEMFVAPGIPAAADLNIWRPIEPDADAAAAAALAHLKAVFGRWRLSPSLPRCTPGFPPRCSRAERARRGSWVTATTASTLVARLDPRRQRRTR